MNIFYKIDFLPRFFTLEVLETKHSFTLETWINCKSAHFCGQWIIAYTLTAWRVSCTGSRSFFVLTWQVVMDFFLH